MKKKNFDPRRASEIALQPLRVAGSGSLRLIGAAGSDRVAALYHEGEGVGFDLTFLTPFDLGRKVLNSGLFRLLTGGVKPEAAQITLGINPALTDTFVSEIFRGVKKAAQPFRLSLDVGNSVQSPTQFFVSIVFTGRKLAAAQSPKPGDILGITGFAGDAIAGLNALRRFGWTAVNDYAQIVRWHLCPEPPLQAAQALASGSRPFALEGSIDGLTADLFRLCQKYAIGVRLQEKQIPFSPQAQESARALALPMRRWALYGSENFGLLVCASASQWKGLQTKMAKWNTRLTAIGEVQPRNSGVVLHNLEGENVVLANRSWNSLVRRKTG